MKNLVWFCFLWAIFYVKSYTQNDTLHSGIYQTDTLTDDTTECYPYKCSVTKCHTWAIGITEGVIHVTGDPADFYEIYLTTFNDSVHLDTCVTLFPFAGGDYLLFFTFGEDAQITICGPENATIIIIAKPDTSQPHPPFKPPFLRLDTLCQGSTPIDEPQQPESAYYYQESEIRQAGLSGKRPIPVKGSERLPNVGYIKAGRVYGDYE